jgi:predicted cupin superfamily sugar epimerase
LRLLTATNDSGPVDAIALGSNVLSGEAPQHIIPPHRWQSAETTSGWALVSCIVSPGFEFSGFTLAPPDWRPRA